jgi:uncharacterized phage protein gp47/JayE
VKTIDEIYQLLMEAYTRRTGMALAEDCDLAVRLYAAAAQLQALDIQAWWVLDQCFPQTAQGTYLDGHALMRGITRRAATKAVGTLRFSVVSPSAVELPIAAGTVCMTAGEARFETTADAVLPAGELFVDAPAEAVDSGEAGNVPAGSVAVLTACPVGITGCTNPAAFSGGSDPENDESLRARVLESYLRLPNGANAAWYEQSAMGHAGVAAAQAVGRARGTGTVDVYIATEAGLPDAGLLDEVQADLQEKREIAVDVEVLAPQAKSVNVAVQVAVSDGASFDAVKPLVEQAVTGLFGGRLLGKSLLLAELGSRIYAVEGVANYRITAPASDVTGGEGVLPLLGTLTVTKMGA